MVRPFEDLLLDEDATAKELEDALKQRNAEIGRVWTGIMDGSIILELMEDDEN